MEQSNSYIEILCVVLGALLAYGFGRFQHRSEYKDELKNTMFGSLLTIDLPNAYIELMNDYDNSEKYNIFSGEVKLCFFFQMTLYKIYVNMYINKT